jgi:hypothetical protein
MRSEEVKEMIMNVKFDNEEIMNLLQQAKEQIDALRTTTMRLNAVLGIAVEKEPLDGPSGSK